MSRTGKNFSYQEFMSNALHQLRQDRPNLVNTEYMKLAAKEWNKYKRANGITQGRKRLTGDIDRRNDVHHRKTGSRTSSFKLKAPRELLEPRKTKNTNYSQRKNRKNNEILGSKTSKNKSMSKTNKKLSTSKRNKKTSVSKTNKKTSTSKTNKSKK